MRVVLGATAALLGFMVAEGAQAQTATWTGPYIGAQAGYGWQNRSNSESIRFDTNQDGVSSDTVRTPAGADAFSPGFCNGAARGATPAAGCAKDDNGVEFGVRAGYDYQMGSLVIGGVAEGTRADLQNAVSAFSTTPASYTMDRKLRELGALRLRGGFAMGDSLIYATGGVAAGRVKHSFATTNTANTFVQNREKWASGYQLGGGVEHKFTPNLALGLEYIRTQLDDDGFVVRAAGPAPATNPFLLSNALGTNFRRSDQDFKAQSVRMTMNYRF